MKRFISFFVFMFVMITNILAQTSAGGFTYVGGDNLTSSSVTVADFGGITVTRFNFVPSTGSLNAAGVWEIPFSTNQIVPVKIILEGTSPTGSRIVNVAVATNGGSSVSNARIATDPSSGMGTFSFQMNPSTVMATSLRIYVSYVSSQQNQGATENTFLLKSIVFQDASGNNTTVYTSPGNGGVTLGVPTLGTPLDGATNTGVSPILNWNTSTGATSYGLQVSTNSSFSSFVVNQTGLTTVSYTLSNLSVNTIYYWKVNASSASQTSVWSGVRSFNTGTTGTTLPDAPTLGAPADGLTGFPLNGGTLNFAPVTGISAYQLELREGSQTGSLINNLVYTTSPITLNNLKYNTVYYWRVSSVSTVALGWSAWRSFTTTGGTIISVPTLLSPANNSTGMVTPISFVWVGVSSALNYEIQISKTNLFSSLEYSATPPQNYQNVYVLYANTSYYWRVRAVTGNNTSDWSAVWSFMIGNTTGVDDQSIPTKFELMQNYPNPFNPVTSIKYSVSNIEYINIAVYDMLGREIAILVNEQKTPGRYEVKFDGSRLSSGMYIYTIRAGNFSATKKMILMK